MVLEASTNRTPDPYTVGVGWENKFQFKFTCKASGLHAASGLPTSMTILDVGNRMAEMHALP